MPMDECAAPMKDPAEAGSEEGWTDQEAVASATRNSGC